MKTYILYHANCPDGFGAAFAAWLSCGSSGIEYIPVSYGQPPPALEPGSLVYILDFSYPREVLIKMSETHEWLRVLDHHATAEQDLSGLDFCRFEPTMSGATMAWMQFHNDHIPTFFSYLEDRDLWKFELPLSREVAAAVRTYPFKFHIWQEICEEIERLQTEGVTALRLINQQAAVMADHARWALIAIVGSQVGSQATVRLAGSRGMDYYDKADTANLALSLPCANATVFFSEVGEELLRRHPDAPCAAYYLDRADGKRQWGLRSRPDFDCSIIAKAFGGGGHPQAAGFTTDI